MIQNLVYTHRIDATRIDATQSGMEESILSVLAYFDIFHYPLRLHEIQKFRPDRGDPGTFQVALDELVQRSVVFRLGDFYSLQNNPLLAYRRKAGNERAAILLPRATRKGRFLRHFPFVRAVGISGSLSKDYADAAADFDFFIITRTNRLWIARTLMHLFKKLAIICGYPHYYCMNYFIDEQALTLDDRNIFSAVELKTLLPVSGARHMKELFRSNAWSEEWLPFCPFRQQEKKDGPRSILKRSLEWLFNNRVGDKLDNFLYQLTTRRWKKKEQLGRKNSKGELMMLHTGKHFARSNAGAFQERVLELYEQKIRRLQARLIPHSNKEWSSSHK